MNSERYVIIYMNLEVCYTCRQNCATWRSQQTIHVMCACMHAYELMHSVMHSYMLTLYGLWFHDAQIISRYLTLYLWKVIITHSSTECFNLNISYVGISWNGLWSSVVVIMHTVTVKWDPITGKHSSISIISSQTGWMTTVHSGNLTFRKLKRRWYQAP